MDINSLSAPCEQPSGNGQKRLKMSITTDCSTEVSKTQYIASLLPCGEENAISTADLVAMAGFNSVRALQKQIEAEREAGSLILSTTKGGYFMPSKDPDKAHAEINAYYRTCYKRALSTLRVLRCAKRALSVSNEQTTIAGW